MQVFRRSSESTSPYTGWSSSRFLTSARSRSMSTGPCMSGHSPSVVIANPREGTDRWLDACDCADELHQLRDAGLPEQAVVIGAQLDHRRLRAAAVDECVGVTPGLESRDRRADRFLCNLRVVGAHEVGVLDDAADAPDELWVEPLEALADERHEALLVGGGQHALMHDWARHGAREDRAEDRHKGLVVIRGVAAVSRPLTRAYPRRSRSDEEHLLDALAALLELVGRLEGQPRAERISPQRVGT